MGYFQTEQIAFSNKLIHCPVYKRFYSKRPTYDRIIRFLIDSVILMMSRHFMFKGFKVIFVILCILYCHSLYLMLSEIQRTSSTFEFEATKIRNQEIVRLGEAETSATVRRFWKLTRSPKTSKYLTTGNLTKYKPSISFSMTNLWGSKVSHSDRILEQLVWAMETARKSSSALEQLKVMHFAC